MHNGFRHSASNNNNNYHYTQNAWEGQHPQHNEKAKQQQQQLQQHQTANGDRWPRPLTMSNRYAPRVEPAEEKQPEEEERAQSQPLSHSSQPQQAQLQPNQNVPNAPNTHQRAQLTELQHSAHSQQHQQHAHNVNSNAVSLAQIMLSRPPDAPQMIEGECFVSIDVECAATGHGHFDLLPCRVAMVDFYGNTLFDRVCSPEAVVDPLQEFTGLTAWQIKRAPSLTAVLSEFHQLLAWLNNQYRHGVTVIGQSVVMDLVWARLVPNKHYRRTIDIAQLFRTANCNFEYKKYQYYSLRQAAWALLGLEMNNTFHDPTEDARVTIQLYRDFCLSPAVLHSARQRLEHFKASCSFPDFRVVTKFKQCSAMYAPSRCACGQKTAVGVEGVEDLEKLRSLYMEHQCKPVLYEQYT